ncbi:MULTISPECIES: FecCD family ABC transporter permease [Micrococcaceae]|uniref:FecCD family ABC transporter permease n=1 Tax=unclassified Kocuria TaxID=2649579 RepID=UPI00101255F4|nr:MULTISPECIES: iron ABC transporter permease [unclassified Kocuria]
MSTAVESLRHSTPAKERSRRGAVLVGVLALFLIAVLGSLFIGSKPVNPVSALDALLDPSSGSPESVIMSGRLSRTVIGVVIGAVLATAGAAMQGVTRNPLGDPAILGINSGATCFVVLGIALVGASGAAAYAVWALVGAAFAAVLVYAIASIGREGATPIKLALVGAAFSAGALSVTNALILQGQETLDEFRHWQIGSLSRATYGDLLTVLPLIALGLVLTVGLASSINNFALGDDMAKSLGEKVALKRFVIFVGITALCGSAVALAGPIAFLGLMIPHALRAVIGPDYRWIMPLSLFAGPVVLLWADVVGRVLLPPTEIEVGVTMAIVGVPIFIYLIRSRKAVNL